MLIINMATSARLFPSSYSFSSEQSISKSGSKWSMKAAFVVALSKSAALWTPGADRTPPPQTLPTRPGHRGKNIPDSLGTFRFMTPTSCPGMFAYLSSENIPRKNSRSQIHNDGTFCLHEQTRITQRDVRETNH